MKNYKTPDSIPVLKRTSNGIEDICFTDEDKANCLNDYFISVSTIDVQTSHVALQSEFYMINSQWYLLVELVSQ